MCKITSNKVYAKGTINIMFYPIIPLFLSHVAVKIQGLCLVYIVYGAKYNKHNYMFLLVSHYPDFLITSSIHAFENYVQSIVLYGLRVKVQYTKYNNTTEVTRLLQ